MRYRQFITTSALCSVIALLSLGIAGCGQAEETVIVKNQKIDEEFPALTDAQIDEVFKETSKVVEAADKDKDPEKLHPRFAGPALSLRSAQYALANKSEEFTVLPLPTQRGTVTLTASQDWPRYVINIASKDKESPTFIELFQQSGARDQFKLSHWVRLFPKKTLPPTAVTKKGAKIIASDADGYKMKPVDAVTKYAENIFDTDKLKEAGFDGDPLATALQADTNKYKEALSSHYEFEHSVNVQPNIVSIALEDGGVLTFAVVDEHMGAKRSNDDARLKLKGEIGTLIGDGGVANAGFSADAKVVTAFVIPAKDSDKLIQVIGAERVFTAAQAL